jgi:hypothetical protein
VSAGRSEGIEMLRQCIAPFVTGWIWQHDRLAPQRVRVRDVRPPGTRLDATRPYVRTRAGRSDARRDEIRED